MRRKSLERLAVDEEFMDDREIDHIRDLTRMRKLTLTGWKLNNDEIAAIGGLTSLRKLDLSGWSLKDEDLERLGLLAPEQFKHGYSTMTLTHPEERSVSR